MRNSNNDLHSSFTSQLLNCRISLLPKWFRVIFNWKFCNVPLLKHKINMWSFSKSAAWWRGRERRMGRTWCNTATPLGIAGRSTQRHKIDLNTQTHKNKAQHFGIWIGITHKKTLYWSTPLHFYESFESSALTLGSIYLKRHNRREIMTQAAFWTFSRNSTLLCRKVFHICLSALTAELKFLERNEFRGNQILPRTASKMKGECIGAATTSLQNQTPPYIFPSCSKPPSSTNRKGKSSNSQLKFRNLSLKKRMPSSLTSLMSQAI